MQKYRFAHLPFIGEGGERRWPLNRIPIYTRKLHICAKAYNPTEDPKQNISHRIRVFPFFFFPLCIFRSLRKKAWYGFFCSFFWSETAIRGFFPSLSLVQASQSQTKETRRFPSIFESLGKKGKKCLVGKRIFRVPSSSIHTRKATKNRANNPTDIHPNV